MDSAQNKLFSANIKENSNDVVKNIIQRKQTTVQQSPELSKDEQELLLILLEAKIDNNKANKKTAELPQLSKEILKAKCCDLSWKFLSSFPNIPQKTFNEQKNFLLSKFEEEPMYTLLVAQNFNERIDLNSIIKTSLKTTEKLNKEYVYAQENFPKSKSKEVDKLFSKYSKCWGVQNGLIQFKKDLSIKQGKQKTLDKFM